MTTYAVIRKLDGVECFRYNHTETVEWPGMEYSLYDHVVVPDAPGDPTSTTFIPEEWYMFVGPFYDRFGAFKLPILASPDPYVQAIIKDTVVRKYIDLKGRRAELLQMIALLQSKSFAVDATAILDVKPNALEVYRA